MMTLEARPSTTVKLTEEQEAVVEKLVRLDKQVQTMGGYAGTGKSTVMAELSRRLPGFATCAYTGKAAQVLRTKGMSASTIHSLIYRPTDEGDGKVSFQLVPKHEISLDGFLVDEASMVSKELHDDLSSLDLPIIYVGDHGQLEPVQDDRKNPFDLMKTPDYALETIHRNAGVIARFAEHLRRGNDARSWDDEKMLDGHEHEAGVVKIITGDKIQEMDLSKLDQTICAYNRTRTSINDMFRAELGLPPDPCVGDRIMCLQNSSEERVFNGMQGTITKIDGWRLTFRFGDQIFGPIRYHRDAFGGGKSWRRSQTTLPFDWAYCITCHKAQGSEWDSVLVLEQRCDLWSHARWAYTAASRAKKELTWVL